MTEDEAVKLMRAREYIIEAQGLIEGDVSPIDNLVDAYTLLDNAISLVDELI